MLCFLKRVLPFTLTLIIGTGISGLFNLFSPSPKPSSDTNAYRLESVYETRSGCRNSKRSYRSGTKSADIIYRPEPYYTEAARRNQTEGNVTLRLTLGADGTVTGVETITGLPDGLTEQARRAAKQIRFNPATRDGSPIDEVRTLTYSFDLN